MTTLEAKVLVQSVSDLLRMIILTKSLSLFKVGHVRLIRSVDQIK